MMSHLKKLKSMERGALIFLVVLLICAAAIALFFFTRYDAVPYSYRDTYFLLVLVVLVYGVWQFFKEVSRRERENELLSLQNRRALESYGHIVSHLREVRALKHEMRNHLAATRIYLEDGRFEEARSYLSQYGEQADAVTDAVYHDNFLVNAIVGNLLQSAGEHGIQVDLNLKAAPIRVAEPDLYSLLSRLPDNALEACAAMPDGLPRFIHLTISRREPYLHIRCENSKSGEIISVDEKIQSDKPGRGHGYGLWTIERVVDAYNGIMSIEHDARTFTVSAALKDLDE